MIVIGNMEMSGWKLRRCWIDSEQCYLIKEMIDADKVDRGLVRDYGQGRDSCGCCWL